LDLKQMAQSEQIESEHASCTHEIEGLKAQIDILRCDDEVRNNDLRELRSQLDELTQRLETKILQHKLKFHQHSELTHTGAALLHSETFRDQFEPRLASERKTCQELIEAVVKSLPTWLQGLTAMFNPRNENLMSILDARYDDREEKRQEQNQAEISRRTLETTLAGKMHSQKKLIEAKPSSKTRKVM